MVRYVSRKGSHSPNWPSDRRASAMKAPTFFSEPKVRNTGARSFAPYAAHARANASVCSLGKEPDVASSRVCLPPSSLMNESSEYGCGAFVKPILTVSCSRKLSSTTGSVVERGAHMCSARGFDSYRRDDQRRWNFEKAARQGRHSRRDRSWKSATLQRAPSSCCHSALFLRIVFAPPKVKTSLTGPQPRSDIDRPRERHARSMIAIAICFRHGHGCCLDHGRQERP